MLEEARRSGRSQLFTLSPARFLLRLRELASECGLQSPELIGSHSLRRGMARDIVDAGGSLSTLLHEGDWKSAAVVQYLRENQVEERAVADMLIDHSESE